MADERDHQEVVERLAGHRRTPLHRTVVSYLVPGRTDWVDECCAEYDGAGSMMLMFALGTPRHVELLGGRLVPWAWEWPTLLGTVIDGLGTAAVPLLLLGLERHPEAEHRRPLLDALALLPSDEAFQALLDRAGENLVESTLLTAMRRFPVRVLRLLARAVAQTSKPDGRVAALLGAHLRIHPELVRAMPPGLDQESRAAIEAAHRANAERLPEASAEALPPLLTAPPWTRDRDVVKPVVIRGLTPPAERVMVWETGERERWAELRREELDRYSSDYWERSLTLRREGRFNPYLEPQLFAGAPLEQVRPLIAGWEPDSAIFHRDAAPMWPIVARFEADALPAVVRAVKASSAHGGLLLPFLAAEAASVAAEWLVRLKGDARGHALAWFERHGVDAVPYLVPAALGKPGGRRSDAEAALRRVAAKAGVDEVANAARAHGEKAARAIEEMLRADPLEHLPAKMPVVGAWAEPETLPQVLLRDRAHALPTAAVGHLITVLALSKPDEVYAGVEVVRELCDPGSLTEFSWALFDKWRADGTPTRDGWVLHQLSLFGDDDTVRRLTPVIRAWPGQNGHAKAVAGLDVLAAIGTDVALMHLYGIAQKAQFKGLKTRAQEKVAEVAAELGLTTEQLADRLVPDFGLDAGGGMVLDYGPRRFLVGFDEGLKPYVVEEGGKPRASLPKPGAKDDPELAPAAYKRFAALKKDVRTVASDQLTRLETAMVTRRSWPVAEFTAYLVNHPLVWHIVRRLVWLAEDGGTVTAFRVAEDRTFADVEDETLTLPGSALVRVAHPVELGGSLGAWSQVFADYEIIQPFPQLSRPVYALTEQERASGRLRRFEDTLVTVGALRGLARRGWEWDEPHDAGLRFYIAREVAPGRHVVLGLFGHGVGDPDPTERETITYVWIGDRPDGYRPGRDTPWTFGELDPVTASELLAELTKIIEPEA
ncbi:DUF4132 domain-containing protein [Thermopolyspora sp. NPDC052614]|uniref:DUF4132 domain-containing protein n=1 Tax=Thermopolyspora sp. NPDC052614 TaxID=3155682 RepID=UPI003428851F